jgi:FkbM family methyltransferase
MDIRVIDGRHGRFFVYAEDEIVGRSLDRYGEYSEEEVTVIDKCLRPGEVAIDVGANIGALTVPMAKKVGPQGRVIVYEACPQNADLLRRNLAANGLDYVEVHACAASAGYGSLAITPLDSLGHKNFGRVEVGGAPVSDLRNGRVPCTPIDGLHLSRCKFIKIDAEGHERQVLMGARATIARCRPIIYCENDREEHSERLIAELTGMGYRLYWHQPPLFNPQNYRGEKKNIFGRVVSRMMVCVPEESGIEVENLDEVMDIRDDDQMFTREIARYETIVARNPDDLMARLMVAHCSNLMQRDPTPFIEENLRRDPGHKPTLFIKSMHDLQRGKWAEGWRAFELRFSSRCRAQFGGERKHDVPRWDGQPTDKTVLIWAEQGFGDMIMFARFFEWVRARAPNAILEVQPELYELFEQSQVSPAGLYRLGRSLRRYDLHCSLPSLPHVFGAGKEMIEIDAPYLFADPILAAKWRERTSSHRIGICNCGSPRSERPYMAEFRSVRVSSCYPADHLQPRVPRQFRRLEARRWRPAHRQR